VTQREAAESLAIPRSSRPCGCLRSRQESSDRHKYYAGSLTSRIASATLANSAVERVEAGRGDLRGRHSWSTSTIRAH